MRQEQSRFTKAQQMMIDDGFPTSLFITAKQREQSWSGRKLTVISSFVMSKTLTPEASAIIETLAEQKQMRLQARKIKQIQHKITPDPRTHHWDTYHNRWALNRIYKREDNMRPDFYTLNNAELVQAFNEMAVDAASLQIPIVVVKRFKTRNDGLRRCEALYKAICEKKSIDYENPPAPPQEQEAVTPTKITKSKPVVAKKAQASKSVNKVKKAKKEGLAISEACGVRGGTKQETILLFLEERLGKQVPQTAILKHAYNDPTASCGPLRLLALTRSLKKARGYTLKQEKDDKGNVSYGLYKT